MTRGRHTGVSRRQFLKTGSGASAALVVGFHWSWEAFAEGQPPQQRPTPNPFDAWIRIAADGTATLLVSKSEMGQGIKTSLPMILAEELDVDWKQVRVEQAPTNPTFYNHGTGGSTSVRTLFTPLRQAGAAARQMLVQAAATRWQVEPATCRTRGGVVFHDATKKRAGYGELVNAAATLPIPDMKTVPLKDPSTFSIIGTSLARTDIPSKVNGSAKFGIDTRVPGMLYAAVARCPVIGGTPKGVDASKAKSIAGVRDIVEIAAIKSAFSSAGVAVVATSTWAAISGRDALKIEWNNGPNAGESSTELHAQMRTLTASAGTVVRNDGDAMAALSTAATKLEAVYEAPFQAHAPMEPMNCTVDVRADGAEAWVPSQSPHNARTTIAEIAGLPADKVVVHTALMGGGFGRRAMSDFVAEAAQISKAVKAPVKLQWTRDDDMQHGFFRQAACHRFKGALDKDGKPVAWLDRLSSTSIAAFMFGGGRAEGTEIGGAADVPYAIPNLRMEYQAAKSGVPVTFWRSVQYSFNPFAVEGFIDEMAAAAKVDPLEFRLRLLAEPRRIPPTGAAALDTQRFKATLELAAKKAGWGTPLPKGRGRGIACIYGFQTYVAQVAEVSVGTDGKVRVHRVVTATDCGRVINPDIVAGQMESGTIYGLSAALKGSITVKGGRVEQENFDTFEVVRVDEAPVIETYIVPSTEAPTGTGEPATGPIAAAVANAIFAATGKRVRRLPITPKDVV